MVAVIVVAAVVAAAVAAVVVVAVTGAGGARRVAGALVGGAVVVAGARGAGRVAGALVGGAVVVAGARGAGRVAAALVGGAVVVAGAPAVPGASPRPWSAVPSSSRTPFSSEVCVTTVDSGCGAASLAPSANAPAPPSTAAIPAVAMRVAILGIWVSFLGNGREPRSRAAAQASGNRG